MDKSPEEDSSPIFQSPSQSPTTQHMRILEDILDLDHNTAAPRLTRLLTVACPLAHIITYLKMYCVEIYKE